MIALAQDAQQSTLQALERSNQLAPRIQIALARIQFQEERVRRATRRMETAHDEVANAQHRRDGLTEILRKPSAKKSRITLGL
ncbi:MAG: hypothetical protein HYX25_06380 [Candidatus Solibacter usitatus]|nr:hypothetical protein [Candidatus Solibacter usitatus]